jgi:hypothetical protein
MLGASVARASPTLLTNEYQLAGANLVLADVGPETVVAVAPSQRAERHGDVGSLLAFGAGAPAPVARVRFGEVGGEFSGAIRFAASASREVVLGTGISYAYKGQLPSTYEALLSAPLGQRLLSAGLAGECPLTKQAREEFTEEGGPLSHTTIAASGDVVAYDSFGCVIVHDFASGLQRTIPLEAFLAPWGETRAGKRSVAGAGWASTLRLGGRLLAFRANPASPGGPAAVVVENIDSGEILYRAALPPDAWLGSQRVGPTFDIDSDGTLLVDDANSCTATVANVFAGRETHPLGIAACAVRRVLSGRALLLVPGRGEDRLLAWSSLQAPQANVIADLGRDGVLEPALAETDGASVVYAVSDCQAPRIYRAALEDAGTARTPPSRCPIRTARQATLTRSGLSLQISCPLGCEGGAEAQIGSRAELRRGQGSYVGPGGLPSYSLAPGGRQRLWLTEGWEELKPLLRQKTRLVRIVFDTNTPAGHSPFIFDDAYGATARELGVRSETNTVAILPVAIRLHIGRH